MKVGSFRRHSRLVIFFILTLLVAVQAAEAQPMVNVTHSQSLYNDLNGNGEANAGDTIQYTVSLNNTGDGPASNLSISLTLDPNTTLVPGSLNVHPLAIADFLSIQEDAAPNSTSVNLLTNDAGLDPGETLSVLSVGGSSTPGTVAGMYGSLTWDRQGNATYTLNNSLAAVQNLDENEIVSDDFTYSITDGSGFTNSDTLSVVISGVNDIPVANADSFPAYNNRRMTVDAAHGVLANDTDGDAETLFVANADSTTSGGATISVATDGSFVYTPVSLTTGGTDTFHYTVSDGTGATSSATATLTGIGRLFFVDNSFGGSGDGSAATPYPTFSMAIGSNQPNDIIYVMRGTGTSTGLDQTYTLPANNMQILGQGVPLVINGTTQVAATSAPVFSNAGTVFVSTASSLTFAGINIDLSGSGASAPVQINNSGGASNLNIRNVSVTQSAGAFDIQVGSSTAFTMTVQNSTFSDCDNCIIVASTGSSSNNVTITGSQFNASNSGFEFDLGGMATGVLNMSGNTITGNTTQGVSLSAGSSTMLTANLTGSNVISGSTSGSGIILFSNSATPVMLNIVPGTNPANSIVNNDIGICNDQGHGTLVISPAGQVNSNTTANISNGLCG